MQPFPISLTVNSEHVNETVEPRLLLSDFIRHTLGLTGTHVGCEHGVCGACTILFDGEPVRSCIMLAVQANNHTIETVESLGTSASVGFEFCSRYGLSVIKKPGVQ